MHYESKLAHGTLRRIGSLSECTIQTDWLTLPECTIQTIFYCIASCKLGVLDDAMCLATCNASHCIASCKKKLHRVTGPLGCRDYSKLDLLPLLGVVKIFLELKMEITGLAGFNCYFHWKQYENVILSCYAYQDSIQQLNGELVFGELVYSLEEGGKGNIFRHRADTHEAPPPSHNDLWLRYTALFKQSKF